MKYTIGVLYLFPYIIGAQDPCRRKNHKITSFLKKILLKRQIESSAFCTAFLMRKIGKGQYSISLRMMS